MKILLTDEEIAEVLEGQDRSISKAQLKKVVEWLNEPCFHSKIFTLQQDKKVKCFACWQALLKEVGQ